jgi:site-specific recombinase XerC
LSVSGGSCPPAAIPRPPLTELEQATLVKVTGEHCSGYRDHVIFAVTLSTGLPEHKIAALDVGNVQHEDGRVRCRIAPRSFKRSSTEPATQEVFLPDGVWYKLGKLVSWKRRQGESVAVAAPLFVSRRSRRISLRACANASSTITPTSGKSNCR